MASRNGAEELERFHIDRVFGVDVRRREVTLDVSAPDFLFGEPKDENSEVAEEIRPTFAERKERFENRATLFPTTASDQARRFVVFDFFLEVGGRFEVEDLLFQHQRNRFGAEAAVKELVRRLVLRRERLELFRDGDRRVKSTVFVETNADGQHRLDDRDRELVAFDVFDRVDKGGNGFLRFVEERGGDRQLRVRDDVFRLASGERDGGFVRLLPKADHALEQALRFGQAGAVRARFFEVFDESETRGELFAFEERVDLFQVFDVIRAAEFDFLPATAGAEGVEVDGH